MSRPAPEAAFRQAMATLSDPATIAEWPGAIAAIDRAAEAGLPDACERRALLECRGAYRPADWGAALDWLARAAAGGSDKAARQFILLADDRYAPQEPLSEPDWGTIRARVDIGRRLRPPTGTGRTVSTSPLIHAIGTMASPAECRWLIDAATPHLARAEIYSQPGRAHEGRTNRAARLDFPRSDLIAEMIRQRIANELGAPISFFEVSQVLGYAVGEEFVPHRDALDPRVMGHEIARHGQRQATFLIYLNEDFDGGETSFPDLGIEHRGRTGDALLFANLDPQGLPDARMTHAGRPPTRGEKWVFSQWIRNRAIG